MNLKVLGQVFMAMFIVSLVGYGFSFLGVPGSLVDSFWKLIALSLAISIIAGYAYPHVRGIKKDDQLLATIRRDVMHNNALHQHVDNVVVVATDEGRIGQKIKVKLWNGKRGEGVITQYAGTLTPATIRLTESEM
ncbi:hypothetical protein HY989_00780 [Candidatus Micrarchaeota archaeon]|nr:hypothetical protein [Candidatus Micrarchaeota archaeon]